MFFSNCLNALYFYSWSKQFNQICYDIETASRTMQCLYCQYSVATCLFPRKYQIYYLFHCAFVWKKSWIIQFLWIKCSLWSQKGLRKGTQTSKKIGLSHLLRHILWQGWKVSILNERYFSVFRSVPRLP